MESPRPNILFAIADDWGWPHAGAYGDAVVKTPTFDRLAREGALYQHAYVSSPSCTPSRGAILTGQWHWRLDGAANLWSVFPDRFTTYPELLEQAGYAVGSSGKGWGPGRVETPKRVPSGRRYQNFEQFMQQRDADKPFCYWLGSSDPHRPYEKGSGAASGMDLDAVRVPACYPDHPEIRGDVADYYWEVQRFDALVGAAVELLEKTGQLDNTLIVMTGDHGMPFPRGKGNLYDTGTRVPLALRWPKGVKPGRNVDAFVSTTDLAPTFLEAVGVEVPADMSGHSLLGLLQDTNTEKAAPNRSYVLTGKERHVPAQEKPDMGGYPCRSIRTHDYLYIRNYRPERWPAGTPDFEQAAIPGSWLADCDNGPTKSFLVEHQDENAELRRYYDLSFGKRPAEELYDLKRDPDQLHNVADESEYAAVTKRLAGQLSAALRASGDPRELGQGDRFDAFPYLGGSPKHPSFEAPAKPRKKRKRPQPRT
jgi:arylsulfatase A-like enzyme